MPTLSRDSLLERVRNTTAGRFDILRERERGEMDANYVALDLRLRREVAIAVLVQDSPRTGERSQAMYRAARENARLHHPNILEVYSVEETDDLLLLVSRFVESVSIADIFAYEKQSSRAVNGGAPEIDDALPDDVVQLILENVARALVHAHEQSVIHGSLSPSDIHVTPEGDVLVSGFGVARSVHATPGPESNSAVSQAIDATYLSPEQCEGTNTTDASDQYALGTIAYELLTGQPIFVGTFVQLCVAHLSRNAIPIAELRPDAPKRLVDAIMRMLVKQPSERFASMRTAALEIESFYDLQDGATRSLLASIAQRVRDAHALVVTTGTAIESADALVATTGNAIDGAVGSTVVDTTLPPHAPMLDENVQFTAYRPAVVRPAAWYSMLVFAHLAEAPSGSLEPDPVVVVENQARQILEGKFDEFQKLVHDSSQAIPRDGTLTFVPEVADIEFNPPRQSFLWAEQVHRADFRMRAAPILDGKTARGRLTVFLGAIIVADIALSIRVDSAHSAPERAVERSEASTARPYRRIFASYSHKDVEVVRQFEIYAKTLGDRYLIDANDLRAGEVWNDRLMELIRDADIVQLFWSSNSMHSQFVRQEWEYALSLGRPNFVRPTFWENPLPSRPESNLPPDALLQLHFQKIQSIGKSARRSRAPVARARERGETVVQGSSSYGARPVSSSMSKAESVGVSASPPPMVESRSSGGSKGLMLAIVVAVLVLLVLVVGMFG
ncbi:MAG: protein kinase [Gemmatimonadaceae bacterium]